MDTATPIPPGIEFVESPPVPGSGRAKVALVLCLVFFAALGAFLYVVLHGESVNIKKSADQFDDVIELGPGTIPKKDLNDAQELAVIKAYAKRRTGCLKRAGDDVFERDDCGNDDLDFVD